jgi:flavin-binding protein dodecin
MVLETRGNYKMEHVYQSTELTGSSKTSLEDAIQNAIARASKAIATCGGLRLLIRGATSKMARYHTGRSR